jgi:excisionase family DNA binding protein
MRIKFFYSRKEAATLLSLSLREIDRLIGDGTLKTRRHGRRRLVLGESLTQFALTGRAITGPNGDGDKP